MDIKNNIKIDTNAAKELYASKSKTKDDKLTIGQKTTESGQINDDAVSLKISSKSVSENEVALENLLAASSNITDVSKAEEMIREANRRILENADDAVLAQASQTADVAVELLK